MKQYPLATIVFALAGVIMIFAQGKPSGSPARLVTGQDESTILDLISNYSYDMIPGISKDCFRCSPRMHDGKDTPDALLPPRCDPNASATRRCSRRAT